MPNEAHKGTSALEKKFNVMVITQNIDDLHERAGSKNVLHLHGEIFKMRSVKNDLSLYEINGDILLGDRAPDGFQLRPHVVWFGESVPKILEARNIMATADLFALVGTSLQVYPASGLIDYLPDEVPKYIIDNNPPYVPPHHHFHVINKSATEGVAELLDLLQ